MKRFYLFAAILATLLFVKSSQAQWSEIPLMPHPLSWTMTAMYNGTFYTFGGISDTGSTGYVYTYKPGDASWTELSVKMPNNRFGGYAAVVGSKIYVLGGLYQFYTHDTANIGSDNSTWVFDPAANTFTTGKPMPIKTAFYAAGVIGTSIYVVNGSLTASNGTDVNVAQIYDVAGNSWTEANTTPPFSNRLAASAVLGGKIYVMGGVKSNYSYYSQDVWIGTPGTGDVSWVQGAAIPYPWMRASGGTVGGKLVFTGGVSNTIPPDFSNTYLYDTTTKAWTSTYALPIATYNGGQLFGTGNDLYFAGGYQNRHAYKFTLSSSQLSVAVMQKYPVLVTLSAGQSQAINFNAENLGVAPLTVSVSIPDNAKNWLSASANMSVSPLITAQYSLTCNAGTLSPGLYQSTATVTTNDALHPSFTIKVEMYVLPNSIVPQPMNVVIEEGTGDWCGYCPDGADIIQNLKDNYTDQLIVLAYHDGPYSNAPSIDPLGITAGHNLMNDFGGPGYPCAAIQRDSFPAYTATLADGNRGAWNQEAQSVLNQNLNAAIGMTIKNYTFDKTTRKLHAVIGLQRSFAMVSDTSLSVHLTTEVTEDGLTGAQEDYIPNTHVINPYTWNDIVRQMYPNEYGTLVNFPNPKVVSDVIAPGDTVDVTIDLTVPGTIKKDSLKNCNVTFFTSLFTNRTTFGTIYQGIRTPLIAAPNAVNSALPANFSLEQNMPNPVNGTTAISYSLGERMPVTLTVHDMLGREVARLVNATQDAGSYSANFNTSNIPSGSYIYTLSAGSIMLEKTMTVVK